MLAGLAAGTAASFGFFGPAFAAQVSSAAYLAQGGESKARPFLYRIEPGVTRPFFVQDFGPFLQKLLPADGLRPLPLSVVGDAALREGASEPTAAQNPDPAGSAQPTAARNPAPPALSEQAAVRPSAPSAPAAAATSVPAPQPESFVATAYDRSAASNGPWGAVDYFGQPLKFGDVAVDPKVIPLGTRLWITGYSDPSLPKGGFYATADDEGGAIQGNRIDIYLPSSQQAVQFGIETVRVLRVGR